MDISWEAYRGYVYEAKSYGHTPIGYSEWKARRTFKPRERPLLQLVRNMVPEQREIVKELAESQVIDLLTNSSI